MSAIEVANAIQQILNKEAGKDKDYKILAIEDEKGGYITGTISEVTLDEEAGVIWLVLETSLNYN